MLAVSCTWHWKLNGSALSSSCESMSSPSGFFLLNALSNNRKHIISGLFVTRDTVTCHSECKKKRKKKRKSYNDSYLNFIFLFHFPVIVSLLYSPWLTVTLSWHAEHTWMVDWETWYHFLPCFWIYGKPSDGKGPSRNGSMWMTHTATIV